MAMGTSPRTSKGAKKSRVRKHGADDAPRRAPAASMPAPSPAAASASSPTTVPNPKSATANAKAAPLTINEACLQSIILARISVAKGATRTDLSRDIAPHTAHKLSPAEWRQMQSQILDALKSEALISEKSGRLHASETGTEATRAFLGVKGKIPANWPDIAQITLMAKALDLQRTAAKTLKMLDRPDILRALILQKSYALKIKGVPTPARLRAALAIVALERAFGNQITSDLGSAAGISAKAARLLAGQLSLHPRDFATDKRLITALAAEALNAAQSDMAALHRAMFRLLLSGQTVARIPAAAPVAATTARTNDGKANRPIGGADTTPQQTPLATRPAPAANSAQRTALSTGHTGANLQQSAPQIASSTASPAAAPQSTPSQGATPTSGALNSKPDLRAFTKEVHRQANQCAQGWSGDRKAFISHVWQAIRNGRPEWGLSAIEFKCMLLEAHHVGHVLLAYADLKDKSNIEDVKNSAIDYKSTIWHFIRVEE